MIELILIIIVAYLLGSLSSAIIICKLMKLPDPRTSGSGNPGATNVLRLGGKKAAALTLLGDFLKGVIAVFIGRAIGMQGAALALVMFAAFLGHLYPIFFKFQGGKGVATGIGGLFALNPLVALCGTATWIIIAILFRISSLAALIAAILIPVYNLWLGNINYQPVLIIMLFFLIFRHKKNIERLLNGTEKKIGK